MFKPFEVKDDDSPQEEEIKVADPADNTSSPAPVWPGVDLNAKTEDDTRITADWN
jgi:hypothetical protein